MGVLRRRAWSQWVARAAALAGAAGGGVLVLSSAFAGPVVTPLIATLAWSAVALAALYGVWRGLRPARTLAGPKLTGVLSRHDRALPSRVRTALELEPGGSPESEALRRAHVRAVDASLRAVAPEHLLPWSRMRTPQLGAALLGTLLWLALLATQSDVRIGALALFRPATSEDGVLSAPVVTRMEARLVFPSYLNRNSENLLDPAEIRAPRGTTVELAVEPALEASSGAALIGEHEVRLRDQGGRLVGRFVVRSDGLLRLRLRDGDQWYEDNAARRVHALSDNTPEIVLQTPVEGAWVQPDASQEVRFEATDDTGLTAVDVAVRLPGGSEHRRRVWSAAQAGGITPSLQRASNFLPSALGVRAGDRFELWLEARDGDVVTGPNVGHSAIVVLEAASDAQHLSQHIPRLRSLLDQSLTLLADRLERPVPESGHAAAQRFTALRVKTMPMLAQLARLVTNLEQATEPQLDVDALRGVHRRQDKLFNREKALYRGNTTQKARARHDARTIDELERDSLLIEDMLAEAHVDEAGALAEELQRLQERIGELLQKLDAADSEEARRQLSAEIARAEGRMRELMRSLSQMATQVPSEFVNEQAMEDAREPSAADNLRDLRSAVGEGDLDAAARHLESLRDQLTRLTESLREGGLRFRQARHGERDQAMSAAQEQLSMLADEQGRLAQRSGERVREAMRSASPDGAGAHEALRRQAQQLGEAVDAMGKDNRDPTRARAVDQARQRVNDAKDALQTGDLSEARRMAAAAERSIDQVADGMEMEARMFQGHDGAAGERAERARETAQRADSLERNIGKRMPELSEHLSPQQRGQMRGDARSQGQLRGKAQELQDSVDKGPDGLPLSPDGSRTLQEATEAMRRAEQQLRGGDTQGAGTSQEQATEKLQQVAEQLRRRQEDGEGEGEPQKSGEGEGQEGGDGPRASHAPVRIPGDEDFNAPKAMRRRLLDAMREARPTGFEEAVERYYEELLR